MTIEVLNPNAMATEVLAGRFKYSPVDVGCASISAFAFSVATTININPAEQTDED